jgi:hypothetical protein
VSGPEDLLGDLPREERVLPEFRCCGKANRPVPRILPGRSKTVGVKSKIVWSRGAMSKTGQGVGDTDGRLVVDPCYGRNAGAANAVPAFRPIDGVYLPELLPFDERFFALVLSNAWQGAMHT